MRHATEWDQLGHEELALLQRRRVFRVYKPKQVIFYQGNPCHGLYCVASGTVGLRRTDAEGHSVLARLVQAGETMGYRTFFGGGIYAATAEALQTCSVCFIDRKTVHEVLDRDSKLSLAFLHRLAVDLRESEEAFLRSASMPVRRRLGHLLLSLRDRHGVVDDTGNLIIKLPMARRDVAAMLGTRPETVARTLKALEGDGVAFFRGRRVTVPDLDALMDEVEPEGDGYVGVA